MTYADYINETTQNCIKVISECSANDIADADHVKEFLWVDDRVTGIISGRCTSLKGSAEENIQDVLFDEEFLKDFTEDKMDMQVTMTMGPEAIDAVARYLALKHISIVELIENERKRRSEKDCQTKSNPVRV
ncbi:MAG: hypothetical protein K5779_08550 [Saccharofermentans sp.]|nr:hypothetical protein [Saccharofermentans sp.]